MAIELRNNFERTETMNTNIDVLIYCPGVSKIK